MQYTEHLSECFKQGKYCIHGLLSVVLFDRVNFVVSIHLELLHLTQKSHKFIAVYPETRKVGTDNVIENNVIYCLKLRNLDLPEFISIQEDKLSNHK